MERDAMYRSTFFNRVAIHHETWYGNHRQHNDSTKADRWGFKRSY